MITFNESTTKRVNDLEFHQESVPAFKAWQPGMGLAEMVLITNEKRAYWQGVLARCPQYGFELTDADGNLRATLTISSRAGIDWQLTQYDQQGAFGHSDIVGTLDQSAVQKQIMDNLLYSSGDIVKYAA